MADINLDEEVEKIDKGARKVGQLFDDLVDWWENNLTSWHRFLAVIAAGGTIGIFAFAGYSVYHRVYIDNGCQLQELSIPPKS